MDFSPITILILMVSIFLAIKIAGKLYISHSRDESHKADYPYFKNSFLLTPAEISFKHILKIAVGESYEINTKVRLADLISVHKGLQKPDWSRAFNLIKAKHIDFVLVDKETTEILCAIELDDTSHDHPDSKKRDVFKDKALASARLPLLRFKALHTYRSIEVKEKIDAALTKDEFKSVSISQNSAKQKKRIEPVINLQNIDELGSMKCPTCDSDLIERQASKGSQVVVKFLGCTNFPKCHYRKIIGNADYVK